MKKLHALSSALAVVWLLALAATAQGLTIDHTWTFTSSCYATSACGVTSGTAGNVRTAPSDNGLNVNVSAYAFTNPNGTGASVAGWLGQYLGSNYGLGVTNSSGDGSHTVDNQGYRDYVVFQFSSAVNVTGYYLNYFNDTDSTWYAGTLPSGYDFTGLTLAQVNALGLTTGNESGNGSDQNEVLLTGVTGNIFIIAARLNDTYDADDRFKIRTLTGTEYKPDNQPHGDPSPVPEPGTLLLLGSGLAAFRLFAGKKPGKSKS